VYFFVGTMPPSGLGTSLFRSPLRCGGSSPARTRVSLKRGSRRVVPPWENFWQHMKREIPCLSLFFQGVSSSRNPGVPPILDPENVSRFRANLERRCSPKTLPTFVFFFKTGNAPPGKKIVIREIGTKGPKKNRGPGTCTWGCRGLSRAHIGGAGLSQDDVSDALSRL